MNPQEEWSHLALQTTTDYCYLIDAHLSVILLHKCTGIINAISVFFLSDRGAVVAVILWQLNLQVPMQSVPITTEVASPNLDQGEVFNIM